jgi:acyl-CoA thioesterase
VAAPLHRGIRARMTSTFEPSWFPLRELLGISIEVETPGRVRATADADNATLNPYGVVHGAVLFALADTAMGAATMSVVDEGMACASIEVHIRFLRPMRAGRITIEAEVLRAGRRVVQLEAKIRDEHGEPVGLATGSFAVCRRDGSAKEGEKA